MIAPQPHGSAMIDLDRASGQPVRPSVIDAMAPWWSAPGTNPHARHAAGRAAARAVEAARAAVGSLIGAHAGAIHFTSGTTEANNLAILGVGRAAMADGRNRLISWAGEHASILEPMAQLAREGADVCILPIDHDGRPSVEALANAVSPTTALVAVSALHGESGCLAPLATIREFASAAGALVHADATQALGRVPLDAETTADLVSLSATKIGGPAGIGALYVRPKPPIKLVPLAFGGGQENGVRPGSVPTALAVGFGAAALALERDYDAHRATVAASRTALLAQLAGFSVVGQPDWPGIVTLDAGVPADELLAELDDVLIGTGAACNSATGKPSGTLLAMGLDPITASRVIRITIDRTHLPTDIARAARKIGDASRRLTLMPDIARVPAVAV